MTVLYLSLDGMTDPLGQSQVLPYLVGLRKRGYAVVLVSCEKKTQYDTLGKHIQNLTVQAGINWQPLNYLDNNGLLSRQQNVKNMYAKAKAICKAQQVDLVHARSYPASLVALKLKYRFRLPFIFDMRGFWADERIDGKIWDVQKPTHKLLYKYFKRKEKQLLLQSASVVSLTHAAKKYIESTLAPQVEKNKTVVIPCCADLVKFNLENKQHNREKTRLTLGIPNDAPVVVYSGSVGTWYMLNEMVDFFHVFSKKKPGAIFLIVTQGDHAYVRNTMAQKNLPESSYRVVSATRENIVAYLHSANVALFFIKPAFSKMASSPVKLGELTGCGLPVIANAGVGDIDTQALACTQLHLVNKFDDLAYETAINSFLTSSHDEQASRTFAQNYFDLEKGIQQYQAVYDALLKQ